jgi:hypothetical protein
MAYLPEVSGDRITDGTVEEQDLDPALLAALALPVGAAITYEGFTLPPRWRWEDGTPVDRTQYALLLDATTLTMAATRNGTINLTGLTETKHLRVGAAVEGTGIAAGTTVASIVSDTAITLSTAASGSGTNLVTFFPHGNAYESASLTRSTATTAVAIADGRMRGRLAVGMTVTGTGIAGGTTVATVTATGVTLSALPTSNGTATMTFSDPTKFNVPDARGYGDVGLDNMGDGGHDAGLVDATLQGLGAMAGSQTVALTAAQTPLRTHTHSGTTGNDSVDHSHSGSTGTVSADHGHSGTTGTVSSGHVHFANDGRNFQTANGVNIVTPAGAAYTLVQNNSNSVAGATTDISANHVHGFSTGGISANHTHAFTTGGRSAFHTHAFTTGNPSVAEANGAAHSNLQPSRSVNKIVYTGVL